MSKIKYYCKTLTSGESKRARERKRNKRRMIQRLKEKDNQGFVIQTLIGINQRYDKRS